MAEILARKDDLPYIPDDVLLPQFLLDMHHPLRPIHSTPRAWLIEEATGRKIGSDEVSFSFPVFGPFNNAALPSSGRELMAWLTP